MREIAQGGTAVSYRLLQHRADCGYQPFQLRPRDPPTCLSRIDPGPPQRFAYVDIAQPRYDALVEQQQLDHGLPATGCRPQAFLRQARPQRLRPQRGEGGPFVERVLIDQVDRSEPPRIVQRQAVSFRLQNQMVVLADLVRIDPPASAHPQVEDQHSPAVGVDEAIFGPPGEMRDPRAGESLNQFGRERATHVGAAQFQPGDPFPFQDTR